MGDRTGFQLYVYAAPTPEAVAAVFDAVDGYCLGQEFGTDHAATTIELGEPYTDWDASCGISDEVAADLAEAGVSFMCWEDPKYEWLGSLNIHTPELGSWGAECDADGSPVVPVHRLTQLVDQAIDLDELKRAVTEAIGKAHRSAVEQLAKAAAGAVITRPAGEEAPPESSDQRRDWYPTTGSGPERTAHQHLTDWEQPQPSHEISIHRHAVCGATYLCESDRHPDLHVLGADGSVLWCTTCFPDAAPPGPFPTTEAATDA